MTVKASCHEDYTSSFVINDEENRLNTPLGFVIGKRNTLNLVAFTFWKVLSHKNIYQTFQKYSETCGIH